MNPIFSLYTNIKLNSHPSLLQAISSGSLDPKSGMLIDPKTGELIPVHRAKEMGVSDHEAINPDYIFLVDSETGDVTSLGKLIETGKFNSDTGMFTSKDTGKRMSLEDAIAEGLLVPRLEGEK